MRLTGKKPSSRTEKMEHGSSGHGPSGSEFTESTSLRFYHLVPIVNWWLETFCDAPLNVDSIRNLLNAIGLIIALMFTIVIALPTSLSKEEWLNVAEAKMAAAWEQALSDPNMQQYDAEFNATILRAARNQHELIDWLNSSIVLLSSSLLLAVFAIFSLETMNFKNHCGADDARLLNAWFSWGRIVIVEVLVFGVVGMVACTACVWQIVKLKTPAGNGWVPDTIEYRGIQYAFPETNANNKFYNIWILSPLGVGFVALSLGIAFRKKVFVDIAHGRQVDSGSFLSTMRICLRGGQTGKNAASPSLSSWNSAQVRSALSAVLGEDAGSVREHLDKFEDHHICGRHLASLTTEDLRDMQVTSVGHRKDLLAAVTLLQEQVARGDAAPPALGDVPPRSRAPFSM